MMNEKEFIKNTHKWRLKHLSNQRFILILSAVIGVLSGLSAIILKNTAYYTHYLFANGFRYRLHSKNLPGKPDIVLPKYKTVIFVHGCFWHGHEDCKYFVVPKTKTVWWLNKIARNKQLDNEHIKKLRSEKWNVITLFECKLKRGNIDSTLNTLIKKLNKTLSK